MSNLLGVIKAVIGLVYVVEADGSQRLLKEGDRIYSGEEIVTGDSGAVSMELPNGKTLDLGRNSHWSEHGLNAVSTAEHDTQDVASLQKSIADGADPTQALEATAAGNEAPVQIEGGGGGHTLVQLDLTGQIIDPTAGFKTAGLGSPTWELNLPENGLADAGAPPVLPPLVNIDDFAGNDGFINKYEINHTNISGTSNQNHITLTFTDSQKNTITLDVPVSNGHWTLQPDLSGLVEGEITVVATATDVSGRTAESTANSLIDVTDLHDQITIDNVTPDNVININESREAQTSVHGTVGGDAKIGDAITLTVDGKEYHDVVIDLGNGNLGYRINVSTQGLLANPNIHATVTSTDEAGNTTQASSDHTVAIDTNVSADITIHQISGDDILNAAESQKPTTTISGTVGGDARVHDVVTLTVNGHEFTGTVQPMPNGQLGYSIEVNTADLANGQQVHATITTTDGAGNTATATADHSVSLDYVATADITIHQISGDDILNAAESQKPTTTISGTVGGDARVHDVVTLTVNGHEFTGTVQPMPNGQLGYAIDVNTADLANGQQVHASITTTDYAGNTATATADHGVSVDYVATADITIHQIAVDDIINATESMKPTTTVTGTVGGDARVHDVITLTVNGHEFTGTVQPMPDGHLGYAIDVNTADLANGQQVHASITTTDYAGNTATATADHSVSLDYVATADI
ncbi:retention module-containing protein, partial [Buttiauxella gaviniae]|uniref:retention module-containing protein n=1 Tax=Buttiauxella gaviniae TaxID=82990 RepID=UPI0039760814